MMDMLVNAQPDGIGEASSLPEESDEKYVLPSSFSQQRLWFLDQLAPESAFYNVPAAFDLIGSVDVRALERSLLHIAGRHEALRTTFVAFDGEPAQVISPFAGCMLNSIDLSKQDTARQTARVDTLLDELARQPFDLANGPLWRATIIRLADDRHVLLLVFHHIVIDAWSIGVLVRDLTEFYAAEVAQRQACLPALSIQYADFAHWQRAHMQGEALEQSLAYWTRHLAGIPGMTTLPADRARPPIQTYRGALYDFALPVRLSDSAHTIARTSGCTLFMVLFATFNALIHRYTGQTDLVIGTPIANRERSELEPVVGFFVNTLALRTRLSSDLTFDELLVQTKHMTLGGYDRQDVPFEKVVEALQPDRQLNHSPVFQLMFALQNTPRTALRLSDLVLEAKKLDVRVAKFDLTLNIEEDEGGSLRGVIEYNTDLFDEATIARIAEHYLTLSAGLITVPQRAIGDIPLLSESERAVILDDWNATDRQFPNIGLLQLIEEQAEKAPNKTVISSIDRQLTYRELELAANRLANYLLTRGVVHDKPIGICMHRSADLMIGLLAILKTGAAYLPLDPDYPAERINFIIQDSQTALVLTHTASASSLSDCKAPLVCIDRDRASIESCPDNKPAVRVAENQIAYVIYTSGSTGKPKGAALPHAGVVNRLKWMWDAYQLGQHDVFVQKTPYSFDVSVWELFLPLVFGARLVIAKPGGHRDPDYLCRLIESEGVTAIHFVPSMLGAFLAAAGRFQLSNLKRIFCSGEALSPILANDVLTKLDVELHNLYGPTEASIDVTFYPCRSGELDVPIGKPIDNTQIYILDAGLALVPIGVAGELYIGGVGLARGYLGRPGLTAERFVPDPFARRPGQRLYRTGDLARFRADGNIDYLGRIDYQVKLRGFRIELGEIEAAVLAYPGVRETVVVAQGDEANRCLVAYVVADPHVQIEALRAHLGGQLPDYMLPTHFLALEALPLNPNGKVDRRALPAPDVSALRSQAYEAPRNDTETRLAELWADVLGVERIGIHDNFFHLGGHSLLATRLVARVRDALGVELSLRQLFETPTIAQLAGCLVQGRETQSHIAPVGRDAPLTLSFAQQRLWFLDQLAPGNALYHVPLALQVEGGVDGEALARAFAALVARHEILRTTVAVVDGAPVQKISAAPAGAVCFVTAAGEDAVRALFDSLIRHPFDLAAGPLWRATVAQLAEGKHVLMLVFHHIIIDAWSIGVLVRDLTELYAAEVEGRAAQLPELSVQYADFAHWQRVQLQGDSLDALFAYWRNQLRDLPAVLELPIDFPRPAVLSERGASLSFALPAELLDELKRFSREHETTLFMTLLAAFQILLARYTGQTDIVVGSPIANRQHAQVEHLIGFFANTLVLRADLSGNPGVADVLRQVREMTLQAYAHQDLPFEKLVEDLQPARSLSHSPLFQVMFVLQHGAGVAPAGEALRFAPLFDEHAAETAKFDLTLAVTERDDGLQACFEYSTDLFEPATIARLARHFVNLVQALVRQPQARIDALPLLDADERQQLLVGWNATQLEVPDECIHQLVERQACLTPDAVALMWKNQEWTYAQLNARANQLAHELRLRGVKPDVRVAVCVERSIDMVVGLLATLKAGGAYVPIDPSYPADRIAYTLSDASPCVILTHARLRPVLPDIGASVLALDVDAELFAEQPAHNIDAEELGLTAEKLAYVIYTSGSTGKPKGVMVEHRQLTNLLAALHDQYCLTPADRVLQFAATSFDVATQEIFCALVSGATLVLREESWVNNSLAFWQMCDRLNISVVHLTVAFWHRLINDQVEHLPASLRLVAIGGECANSGALEDWFTHVRDDVKLLNEYGPTEATVTTTLHRFNKGELNQSIIGRAIANANIYILDGSGEPVPAGVTGEIYIGGAGVTRGYLNRPDLTAERFLSDPFAKAIGARMYRTGDLGRWRIDGTVEFVGRNDYQVKLRGFRIELGEIEAAVLAYPGVRETVVVAQGDEANRYLVAYVVADPQVQVEALRAHLGGHLPDYMLPTHFVRLDGLPLNPNGKVDRRALPAPDVSALRSQAYEAPRNDTETRLAELWADVLGIERIGIHDNFFHLGGHSLSAIHLIGRIEHEIGCRVPVAELFHYPTIAQLAVLLSNDKQQNEKAQLVALQSEAAVDAPPLVLVHALNGTVLPYLELASALRGRRHVYALSSPVLEQPGQTLMHIEDIAALHAELLTQQFGDSQPFVLAGWSFGGVVALEIARLMHLRSPATTPSLLLLDPTPVFDRRVNEFEVNERAIVHALLADALMAAGRAATLVESEIAKSATSLESIWHLLQRFDAIPKGYEIDDVANMLAVCRSHLDALASYRCRAYPGRASVLLASGPNSDQAAIAWREVLPEVGAIDRIEANHYSLLRQPSVQTVIELLERV